MIDLIKKKSMCLLNLFRWDGTKWKIKIYNILKITSTTILETFRSFFIHCFYMNGCVQKQGEKRMSLTGEQIIFCTKILFSKIENIFAISDTLQCPTRI